MDIVWNHSTEIRVCIAFTTLMQDGFVLGSCIYLLCARLHSTRPWTKCVSGITWTSAKPISTLQLFVLPESPHTYIYILYIYMQNSILGFLCAFWWVLFGLYSLRIHQTLYVFWKSCAALQLHCSTMWCEYVKRDKHRVRKMQSAKRWKLNVSSDSRANRDR